MKKSLLPAILSVVLLMGAGCLSVPSKTSEPSTEAEQKQLMVQVDIRVVDGEPKGQDVILSGIISQTFFFAINSEGIDEAPIIGTEVGREGYYWAGAQYDLIFIQSGTLLQIQQEVRGEDGDISPRQVMKTLGITTDTQVTVRHSNITK